MYRGLALLLALLSVSGCAGWFGGKEKAALTGERISVLALQRQLEPDPRLADLAVRLPRPQTNRDWPQAGGAANNAMHHLSAKGDLAPVWRVSIGEGSDDDTQLLAQPVIAGGRVYTMDSAAEVRAQQASSGAQIWRRRLKTETEEEGVLGGGLAFSGGRLFATTGFGEVFALDAATGKEIWRRFVMGPIRAAPTVYGRRVFVITITNELHVLDAGDGRLIWSYSGITESAGLLGGAGPVVDGSVVVAPFSSGEIVALRVENGRQVWADSLTTLGRMDPISSLAHIRGRPVVDRGRVFVTSNSGRTVAIDLRTGNRVWEKRIGAIHGPWVAGQFIYLLSNNGEVVCLARRTGGIRWVRMLQRFEDEEDREGPIVWSGPVLAGDRLIVAGSNGEVWSISPYSGKLLGRIKVSGPVYITPAIANETVYLLTDDAELVALR